MRFPSGRALLLIVPVVSAFMAEAQPLPPPPRIPPPPRVAPPPRLPAPPALPRVERVVPPPPRPHVDRRVPPPVRVQPPPRVHSDRVYGYRHPPRDHMDREGYRWIPGRGNHEGRWAPHHRPGRHHIWIPGHWRGDMWINGHWALPHRR